MRRQFLSPAVACVAYSIFASIAVWAQATDASGAANTGFTPIASRVIEAIDEAKLTTLAGNTHPLARPSNDRGMADLGKYMERMVLVLKRSPVQEQALKEFNERQYDPASPDYHRWLSPEEFGAIYGPSDSDVAAITNWLQNHGFQIYEVGAGRVTIEFSGTVAQVQQAFNVEMHNYVVNGEPHFANDRDPQIPQALVPVVAGVASLHDFFPKSQHVLGEQVKRDRKTGEVTLLDSSPFAANGPQPELGYVDTSGHVRMDVTPYDFATIYNLLPLWHASTPINGKGVTIAISGLSDVKAADFNTFRSVFGLPATTLKIIHNGTDPGYDVKYGGQGENSLDVEWSGATAPGATIELVVSGSTSTSYGGQLSDSYIVNHKLAPIMSASYGSCELDLGTAGNKLYNSIFQQGATEGISIFESSGDQGSAGCTGQDGKAPYADTIGLQVNGMASSPYVTAVGGTDLNWTWWTSTGYKTYWSGTNAANRSNVLHYIPEVPWNSTCTSTVLFKVFPAYTTSEALCAAAAASASYQGLVKISAGSGGVSHCTTPTGSTSSSCSGGYPKPNWQTAAGVPADGKRDVPDVSLFASGSFPGGLPGSAFLFCLTASGSNGCDYSSNYYIQFQEVGGTSASAPAMAGIMAMIVQKQGGAWQGLANPGFYKLAAKQSPSACNTNTVASGNSCYFYDITTGSNAQVCNTGDPNCVTSKGGDKYGVLSGYSSAVGYDLTTGLGSINAANLVNGWASVTPVPTATVSPATLTFATTSKGVQTAAQVVTLKNTSTTVLTIKSISFGGTNPTSFVKTATTCGTTLPASATCTISVAFKPTAAVALSATLSVADNATGTPQVVTLKGTGK
ncbi:protease pro-enzyme activation domain-containing protein [Telmatobacter sp. DSM 110680]|uniref:Protease pro-enzyme activation domain-containing protein n=1 Tax=Telmatobacter sp. DSM 110680 TaxID=3036704 RepID=A0AAU7DJW4_9BACT